ncbi:MULTISPECIES: hypothetical protein [unclassified Streptomyces]|uniref:hypothetical protein n=1 Tax=unclassified Streptomyces TaxID=2593676 RepID=UPI002E2E44D6|nr:hypothetical protein [Streptomyces sp. NBC_00223]
MPFPAPIGADGALRVSRPVVRTFAPRPQQYSSKSATCMTDFLDHFGLPRDEGLLAEGGGNSFSDMGAELLRALDPPLSGVDVLALAFHIPDLDFVNVAGCALTEHFDGRPDVFSVSGQGVGAPFSALRTLAALYAAGHSERGALFVFDQTTLPYHEPDVHGVERDDCGVLLHTDPRRDSQSARLVFTDERPVVGARQVRAALGEAWRDVSGDAAAPGTGPARADRPPRFVLGSTLAGHLAGGSDEHDLDRAADPGADVDGEVVEGSGRHLCTSAWAALARSWPAGGLPGDRLTVVADYDPHAGRLFQAGLLPGDAG